MMPEEHFALRSTGDGVTVSRGAESVLAARWLRNRWHWHERVFKLSVSQLGELSASDAVAAVQLLVSELKRASIDGEQPILFRVLVSIDSTLLPVLRTAGFMVARHVLEPTIDPRSAVNNSGSLPAGTRLISLSTARSQYGDSALTDLYMEVYARCSRLDPATPERLTDDELAGILFADADLVDDLSCCALLNGVPGGLVPVFRGETPQRFELGPFGVAEDQLEQHETLTSQMLNWVFQASQQAPWHAVQFTAEIDTDDPYTMYACAALPFRPAAEHVSLFFAPRWQH